MTEGNQENLPEPIVVGSHLIIPSALANLDGSDGIYRDKFSVPLVSASNDVEAVWKWLKEFDESPHTLRAYRKEAERLLMWAIAVRKKPLASLDRDDVGAYFDFASELPDDWKKDKSLPRTSPEWRPFRKNLTGPSLRQAKIVLNAMFSWLVDAKYLTGNPLSLMRRKTKPSKSSAKMESKERRRALPVGAVKIVRQWLASQVAETPFQQLSALRNVLIFELFYATGGRLFEITRATMGKLSRDSGLWWLFVVGKGDKEAEMPIPDNVMDIIIAYRTAYNLPPLPYPEERTPLIMRLAGPGAAPEEAGLSDNMIYRLVKSILSGAHGLANELGDDHSASFLFKASTHWLRHTTLTHAYDRTGDVRFVMDLGRHANINTSMRYVSKDRESFHDRVSKALQVADEDPAKE